MRFFVRHQTAYRYSAPVRLSPHRLTAPDLRQDLHYAVRVLRRNPGYALTAMVCLALGIGVNSTVFSMVNELFWQPLPVPHSGRLVIVGRENDGMACSYRDYLEFRQRASAPAGPALFRAGGVRRYARGESE